MEDSDYIIINGDTLFSNTVYETVERTLTENDEGVWLIASKEKEFSEDDMLVQTSSKGEIVKVGKNLTLADCDAISARMIMVKGKSIRHRIAAQLDLASRSPEFLEHTKTWHSFLNDLISEGMSISFLNVDASQWMEVDLHLDFNEVQKIIKSKIVF